MKSFLSFNYWLKRRQLNQHYSSMSRRTPFKAKLICGIKSRVTVIILEGASILKWVRESLRVLVSSLFHGADIDKCSCLYRFTELVYFLRRVLCSHWCSNTTLQSFYDCIDCSLPDLCLWYFPGKTLEVATFLLQGSLHPGIESVSLLGRWIFLPLCHLGFPHVYYTSMYHLIKYFLQSTPQWIALFFIKN